MDHSLAPSYGKAVLLLVLSVLTFLLLLESVIELPFLIPKDYNEGWNAFWADCALSGKPLYPGITDFISNNYPPLSFYIVGSLGMLIGDNIIAGRIIALISLLVVGINIGLIVYLMTRSITIALFTGLLFISYIAVYHQGYVGMNDPQWLAHAVMMTAFVLFLVSGQKGWLFILSLLLIFAAGLIKHNLLPLPLAITVWLFIYNRWAFYRWILYFTIMLVIIMATIYYLYGTSVFIDMLYSPREYSLIFTAHNLYHWLPPLILYIYIALIAILVDSDDRSRKLIILYVIFSAVWGIFIAGGQGVDYNAIFDLIIGLMIISGLMLDRFYKQLVEMKLSHPLIEPTAMFILLLPVLVKVPLTLISPWRLVESLKQKQILVESDIKFIAEHKGPVICESLSLCYWAGKSFEMDFFNTGQKLFTHALSESKLKDLLSKHYFEIIQLNDKNGSLRLPDNINRQILSTYEIRRVSDINVFLAPTDFKD